MNVSDATVAIMRDHVTRLKDESRARDANWTQLQEVAFPVLREIAEKARYVDQQSRRKYEAEAVDSAIDEPHWIALILRVTENNSSPPITLAFRVECSTRGTVRFGTVRGLKARLEDGASQRDDEITETWVADQALDFLKSALREFH